jgi:hypothetical protein
MDGFPETCDYFGIVTAMTEWLNHVATRLDDKAAGERVKAEKILRDDAVRESGTADLWQTVCDAYKSHCDSFNSDPRIRTTLIFSPIGNQFTLGRPDSADKLQGAINPQRHEVTIRLVAEGAKPYQETIAVKIGEDGNYYFCSKAAPGATDIAAIVCCSVEALLGI